MITMKKIDSQAYKEIRTWIYRNARPLDLALWQCHYEDGSREAVIERLKEYQNEDGGFGHALEPDCWNPESSPYETMIAIGILRSINWVDMGDPVLQGIFRFLEHTPYCSEEGWYFGIPSNDKVPRAPWWTYSEETNAVQCMGITAAICAFILRYGDQESGLFTKAADYTGKILARVKETEDFGEMGAGGLFMLAQDIEATGLSARFDCAVIMENLKGLVDRSIERDTEKWSFYTPRPSEFIFSPESPFYPGNEEIVEKELDYLVDTRNPGGVWNITWTWFDLGEQYAKEFAVSENWWMAHKAMEKLRFLKCFGRA